MAEYKLYYVEIFGVVDKTLFRYYVSARDHEEAEKLAIENFKLNVGGEFVVRDVEIIELNESFVIVMKE